jgi:hypothetical protein
MPRKVVSTSSSCSAPSDVPAGDALEPVRDEPAVVRLAPITRSPARPALRLSDLPGETVLIAGGRESGGFIDRVLGAFEAAGLKSRTTPDPEPDPDLGLRAVREGIGVVVYVRGCGCARVPGSALAALERPPTMPCHLAWRTSRRTRALGAILHAVRAPAPLGG